MTPSSIAAKILTSDQKLDWIPNSRPSCCHNKPIIFDSPSPGLTAGGLTIQDSATNSTSVADSPSIEQTPLGLIFSTGGRDDNVHITYNNDGSVTITHDGKDYHFSADEARELIVDLGAGNDTLTSSGFPGAGNSVVIRGGAGNDILNGSTGTDNLEGGDGADIIRGGAGSDHLDGGKGDDQILGGKGSDIIHGGSGDDRIDGGKGHDRIYGQQGNDSIYGGSGDYNDAIYGGAGDDALSGGRGDDFLHGGSGADTVNGGSGSDVVIGGSGADVVTASGFLNQIYQEELPARWRAAPRPFQLA